MDDGTKNSKNSYRLYTCSFSRAEHDFLIKFLSQKFDIFSYVSVVNYKYLTLVISNGRGNEFKNSGVKFRDLIEPYIVESMRYKL